MKGLAKMESYNNFAQFYDMFTDNVNYDEMADFFDKIMEPYWGKDKILLDLACGTGSFSVRFAKKGYDVIGIDNSPMMLSQAMQKAFLEEQNILFLNQDMQEIDLFGTINCCVCTLDSLNHLDNLHDLEETFKRVALFLEDDGVFVFDMNTPYKHRKILSDNCFAFEKDNVFCSWRNETKDLRTFITLDFFVEEDGLYSRFSEEFYERAYEINEIEAALKKCGLRIKDIYNESFKKASSFDCERLFFVTVKE